MHPVFTSASVRSLATSLFVSSLRHFAGHAAASTGANCCLFCLQSVNLYVCLWGVSCVQTRDGSAPSALPPRVAVTNCTNSSNNDTKRQSWKRKRNNSHEMPKSQATFQLATPTLATPVTRATTRTGGQAEPTTKSSCSLAAVAARWLLLLAACHLKSVCNVLPASLPL